MLKLKLKTLSAAVIAAVGASAATAGSIYIEATGFGIDQQTSVQGIPGVSATPSTAAFQIPRLDNYGGGPGWPSSLQLIIDDTTGEVKDFTMRVLTDGVFGSGGPQNDIRYGNGSRYYRAGDLSSVAANCTVAPAAIDFSGDLLNTRPNVPGGGNGDGTTGQLVFHCDGATNTQFFNQLNDRTGLCATDQPSVTTPGDNGCGAAWGGDLVGDQPVQTAVAPQTCLSDAFNLNTGNIYAGHALEGGLGVVASWNIDSGNGDGPVDLSLFSGFGVNNAELFCSTSFYQNSVRRIEHEGRGGRSGGTIIVNHTGSLAGGDFDAVSIEYVQDTDIAFVTQAGPAAAQSFTSYSFQTIVDQANTSTGGAKNVPAMGAFGLAALFAGLVVVATRLRRSVA